MRMAALVLMAAAAALGTPSAQAAVTLDGITRDALRVCADANLLPFSNNRLEGFENRIATLIAEELQVPVTYYWWPQTIGFVRNTLRERRCDIVLGAAVGEELMQNTNPYYVSAYALVYRRDSGLAARSLGDPGLQGARIGIVAQTPPASILLRHGLTSIVPYQLNIDTRAEQPARQAIEDVAAGVTDAAVVWGPVAGFWARRQDAELEVVPLLEEPGPIPLTYRISMGVRIDEPDWKHWLNDFIARRQGDIDRILAEYGVPLVEGRSLKRAAVEEPDGYRMDDFQAPTPASVPGARTITLAEMRELAEAGVPLLDVLRGPPPEEQGRAGWVPKPSSSLPGAIWVPNVGYGALSAEQEAYFRSALEEATKGDQDAPVVLFCKRDCWMSWNASKRAAEWGYRGIRWFPEGTDGWRDAGLPLEPVHPFRKAMN
jgi:quinoprotein dehydrogenase-associated probable ABC transporter substrate-binding protein/PQQ-dependent catabolism-associated CXXCW motif protein